MAFKRKQWSNQSMEIAVASVREGTIGLTEAARMYNLPVESLRRRVHDIVAIDCRPRPSTVLAKEEDRLYQYLLEMADMGYGLNRETVMKLVFTIAEKTEKSYHLKENQRAEHGLMGLEGVTLVLLFVVLNCYLKPEHLQEAQK